MESYVSDFLNRMVFNNLNLTIMPLSESYVNDFLNCMVFNINYIAIIWIIILICIYKGF